MNAYEVLGYAIGCAFLTATLINVLNSAFPKRG